jgi:uncharacterized protein YkwD
MYVLTTDSDLGDPMSVRTLLGKRTAAAMIVVAIAVGITACTPPAPATSTGGPSDPYLSSLFQALNNDRAASGLPALTWSPQLAGLAGAWAVNMGNANNLYHQSLSAIISSPDYASYHTLGENILVGPGSMTPADMEAAWMASAPHRANIQNGSFNIVGIGVYRGPDGRLWAVQDFGGV